VWICSLDFFGVSVLVMFVFFPILEGKSFDASRRAFSLPLFGFPRRVSIFFSYTASIPVIVAIVETLLRTSF